MITHECPHEFRASTMVTGYVQCSRCGAAASNVIPVTARTAVHATVKAEVVTGGADGKIANRDPRNRAERRAAIAMARRLGAR